MPILDAYGDDNQSNKIIVDQTERVYRNNEEMKSAVMFDKDTQIETIARYISGMKWTVDYFLQVKDNGDDFKPLDVTLEPSVQSYYRISDLIIYLQSPINQDDPDNIAGEAVISANFLPNYGDMFIATLAGGREAMFTITSVTKKQYNLHKIYNVEFKLFSILDTDSVNYRNIILKTIKEYIYNKDFILEESAPVIIAADYVKKLNYKEKLEELKEYYFDIFIEKEKNVFAPLTETSIYTDTMLTDFIFKLVNIQEDIRLQKVTRVSIDLSDRIRYHIWDLLIDRDLSKITRCRKDIGWKYTPYTYSDILTRQIGYLGISFIADALDGALPVETNYIELYDNDDYTYPVNLEDNNYVFSEAFYSQDIDNCGIMEKAVLQYLRGELVDEEILDTMLSEYYKWLTEEQFYFIPILWLLLIDKINNIYKAV